MKGKRKKIRNRARMRLEAWMSFVAGKYFPYFGRGTHYDTYQRHIRPLINHAERQADSPPETMEIYNQFIASISMHERTEMLILC